MREGREAIEPKKAKAGFLGFIGMLMAAIFWGLLIGLAINLFLWFERGYEHTMFNLHKTYDQQVTMLALRNQETAAMYVASLSIAGDIADEGWMATKNLIYQAPYVNSVLHHQRIQTLSKTFVHRVGQFFCVLGATFKVLSAKFVSLFASFWVFIFAAIVGAMDGLLTRYIRTVEGGRESTFIFHKVSDIVIKTPIAILFLYLASPFFFNPELVVMVMGFLFFSFFYIATANLKKFL